MIKKYIGYALLAVAILALLVLGMNQFICPVIPLKLDSYLILFAVTSLAVIGALSQFKNVVELIKLIIEEPAQALGWDSHARQKRNREAIIRKVESFWIANVLEKPTQKGTLIDIDVNYFPGKVCSSWQEVIQRPTFSNYTIHRDSRILQIFERSGRELLILGDAGSGKTTMLLSLARDLILEAKRQQERPIPVVLNLSSWDDGHATLTTWLISELRIRYLVPTRVSQAWIDSEELLLLLDGLDEVESRVRKKCIDAINHFHEAHGCIHLVVCSRISDYDDLKIQLQLQDAIILRPLTKKQICNYLETTGSSLLALDKVAQSENEFMELAQSPLMLTIMQRSIEDISFEELRTKTTEERRDYIFGKYIENMFERRSSKRRYSKNDTIIMLSKLSKMMAKNNTTYLLPFRFPKHPCNPEYRVTRLVITMLFGIVGAMSGAVSGNKGGLVIGTIVGCVSGLWMSLYDRDVCKWYPLGGDKLGCGLLIRNVLYWVVLGVIWVLYLSASFRSSFIIIMCNIGILVAALIVAVLSWGSQFKPSWFLKPLSDIYVAQHNRIYLYLHHYIPWNYIRFFNFATERVILRRVEKKNYMFIHRLLQEYFYRLS